jgi:uncharacterized protein YukE
VRHGLTGTVPRLTRRDVRARRLERHALTAALEDPTPAGVGRAVHAVHAQVMSAAELSIGVRLPGSTRTTVREALWQDHTLTKTSGPRGTLHLLPTADLPMWTGAMASVPRTARPLAADVRLRPEQTQEVVAAVAAALEDAELTIEELDEAVVQRTGSWAGDLVMPAFQVFWPRWRQAIAQAAHAGALVFGPNRGRRVTYTSPRRVDPDFAPMPSDQALRGFLRGYLHAYGPATPAHLARWMAAPASWAENVFTSAGSSVERVLVDGDEAWVNAGDTEPASLGRSVLLLPYFDALSIGYQPRGDMFPGRAGERALARGQAGNYPVLVVDGVVRGVWHQRRSGRRIDVTVETWDELSSTRVRALERQVARVAEVLEGDPQLTLGPVTVGPHA